MRILVRLTEWDVHQTNEHRAHDRRIRRENLKMVLVRITLKMSSISSRNFWMENNFATRSVRELGRSTAMNTSCDIPIDVVETCRDNDDSFHGTRTWHQESWPQYPRAMREQGKRDIFKLLTSVRPLRGVISKSPVLQESYESWCGGLCHENHGQATVWGKNDNQKFRSVKLLISMRIVDETWNYAIHICTRTI